MADLINPAGVQLVNSQTGVPEVVPHDSAQNALVSGSHNLQSGGSTNVVNTDGALVSLPNEQIPDAINSGYRLPQQSDIQEHNNETKYGEGAANTAEALAAGAARGVSFGTSDVVLTKSGLVTPETLDQLQQRHPVATDVGLFGSILGAPESGLVGAVGKLGHAVEDAAA